MPLTATELHQRRIQSARSRRRRRLITVASAAMAVLGVALLGSSSGAVWILGTLMILIASVLVLSLTKKGRNFLALAKVFSTLEDERDRRPPGTVVPIKQR